ncbi:4256_t:CDS:1, partial [Gigaspora rosea]
NDAFVDVVRPYDPILIYEEDEEETSTKTPNPPTKTSTIHQR